MKIKAWQLKTGKYITK